MMRRLFVVVLLIQVAFPTQAQDPLGRHHAPEEIVYFLDGEFVMFNQPQVLDVNGDGLDDVVFDGGFRSDDVLTSGFPHPQVVLTRTEDGLMENTADQIFPGGVPGFPGGGFQKIVADFNNDEVNDLLFMRTGPELPCDDGSVDCWPGAQNTLFLGNGDGTLTDVTATHMPAYSDYTHGSSVLDFDRDGDLDLWVNNSPGSELYDPPFSYLLSNNGEGQFTLVADLGDIELGYEPIVGKNGILPEGTWFTGDWTLPIDANGDGSMDLYMKMGYFDYSALPDRRFIWKPSILINHEGGRLEPAPAEAFESIGCRISPWAPHPDCRYDDIPLTTGGFTYDLNNDGLDDLVQPHTIIWIDDLGTEVHSYQFLISNGDGTFRNETSERFPGMPITEVIEPAFLHDLDGDGHADMFLSVNRERLEISINDGEGFFRPLATDWFGPAYVRAVLDVDGDGDTDFLEDKVWGVALHKMVFPTERCWTGMSPMTA